MYYLIEHNRTTKDTNCTAYTNYSEAQMACLHKEQQHVVSNHHEMEVVVFEADSIDDLKRTHSRYFVDENSKNNVKETLMAVGLIGLAVYLLKEK